MCQEEAGFWLPATVPHILLSNGQCLEPLSVTKSQFKFKLRETEAQLSLIESRISLGHVTSDAMLSRMDILEGANMRLGTELRTIRTLLTSSVALRERMELFEQLTMVGIAWQGGFAEDDPLAQ